MYGFSSSPMRASRYRVLLAKLSRELRHRISSSGWLLNTVTNAPTRAARASSGNTEMHVGRSRKKAVSPPRYVSRPYGVTACALIIRRVPCRTVFLFTVFIPFPFPHPS